ncbi:MAG: winged helix DNA-binding protein [Kordiimonadaceae bacterium]|nr:winged helix DNA-binding protein [Kordiimonadaceae bacterium]
MPTNAFINNHPMRGAFVANILRHLVELIVTQGDDLLADVDIGFPSRAVSSVLLLGEQGPMSAADIAKTLDQPHQLVTQRVDLLLELSVVERMSDPRDGRRKVLKLTAKGEIQFRSLQSRLAEAEVAFAGLFEEIGCDLPTVAINALEALSRLSILDRVKALQGPSTN